ncbi:hypothetical protein D3C81_1482480 [compost metagenome]
MGLQVNLLLHIGIRVQVEVVLEQGDRCCQWHLALVILLDRLVYFSFVFGADGLAQVDAQVQQHIDMGATGCAAFERGHQLAEIIGPQLCCISTVHGAQQFSERLVLPGIVCHEQVFVARMECCQGLPTEALLQQSLPIVTDVRVRNGDFWLLRFPWPGHV